MSPSSIADTLTPSTTFSSILCFSPHTTLLSSYFRQFLYLHFSFPLLFPINWDLLPLVIHHFAGAWTTMWCYHPCHVRCCSYCCCWWKKYKKENKEMGWKMKKRNWKKKYSLKIQRGKKWMNQCRNLIKCQWYKERKGEKERKEKRKGKKEKRGKNERKKWKEKEKKERTTKRVRW